MSRLETTHILKQAIRTRTEYEIGKDGSVTAEIETEEMWIHPLSEEGQTLGGVAAVSETAPVAPVTPLRPLDRVWQAVQHAPGFPAAAWNADLQAAMDRHPAGGSSIPAPRKPFEGTVEHPDSDWCQPVIPGLEYLDKVDSIDDEGSPT